MSRRLCRARRSADRTTSGSSRSRSRRASFDDALTEVWNAIAAAGADDALAFAEHPNLPEHWRAKARGPGS